MIDFQLVPVSVPETKVDLKESHQPNMPQLVQTVPDSTEILKEMTTQLREKEKLVALLEKVSYT